MQASGDLVTLAGDQVGQGIDLTVDVDCDVQDAAEVAGGPSGGFGSRQHLGPHGREPAG
ncbi:MAG: hypothetical protein ACRD0L_06145 [Acidimicrobiales bacterium]